MSFDRRSAGKGPAATRSTVQRSTKVGARTLTQGLAHQIQMRRAVQAASPPPSPSGTGPGAQSEERATPGLSAASADPLESIHDTAARGIADANSALPHADPIARSFGPEHAGTVHGIRAQVGGAATEATSAMGAEAYATGSTVAFGGSPDLFTAAHEAAHVVQQQAGVHLKGGVGHEGDAYEQHADAVADRVVAGRSAADLLSRPSGSAPASAAVQRKASPGDATDDEIETKGVPDVVQEGRAESVPDGATNVKPGQVGYARAMAIATGPRAEKNAGYYKDALLTNLVPDLSGFDEYGRVRAHEKELFSEEAEPARVPLVGWSLGGAPSARHMWSNAAGWCQERMDQVEQDRQSEEDTFAKYNAWVPRANGFFTSLERLQAQSDMIGHHTDTGSLGAAILASLDQAETVAHMAQHAHDKGNVKASLPAVPSDTSVLTASTDCTVAAKEMNAAYLAFQAVMISERANTIDHEGDGDRSRLAEINDTKDFLRNVGKTVDISASVVQGAPAMVANATEYVQRAGATANGIRNKRQILNGERPTHNPTYVTVDEHGNTVVRNMQTGTDRDLATGRSGPTEEGGGGLPTNVEKLLGSIADFAFAGEVREINRRLEEIKSRVTSAHLAASFTHELSVTETYQAALNNFAVKCDNLQQRIATRRDQYLEFGIALDTYARSDAAANHAAGGMSKDTDRFATTMVLTSSIRETLAMGEGAVSSFMDENEIALWAGAINGHRELIDCPMNLPGEGFKHVQEFKCTDKEWAQMESMFSQVRDFREYFKSINSDLGPVEARAKAMFGPEHQTDDGQVQGLSPGGGSGEY